MLVVALAIGVGCRGVAGFDGVRVDEWASHGLGVVGTGPTDGLSWLNSPPPPNATSPYDNATFMYCRAEGRYFILASGTVPRHHGSCGPTDQFSSPRCVYLMAQGMPGSPVQDTRQWTSGSTCTMRTGRTSRQPTQLPPPISGSSTLTSTAGISQSGGQSSNDAALTLPTSTRRSTQRQIYSGM